MFSFSPEVHLLVGAQESHELWHLDGLDLAGSVHVEVSPGSWEVGLEVVGSSGTGESLVGVEDLAGGGSGGTLVHPEGSVWRAILVLALESVLLDHGSHEDVIRVGGESGSGDSLVSTSTELTSLGDVEELSGVVNFVITLDLDLLLVGGAVIIRGGVRLSDLDLAGSSWGLIFGAGGAVRGGSGVSDLSVGSVWWSGVGRLDGVLSVVFLENGVSSVVLDGLKGPDWSVILNLS